MPGSLLLVGDSETNQNIYYKTHFLAGDPFIYFENDGRSLLVVGRMEQGRAQKESTVAEVKTFEDFGYLDLVKEGVDRTDAFVTVLERITAESGDGVTVEGRFPVLYADALRERGMMLEVSRDLLRMERRRKLPHEIEAIEAAQRATERAVARARDLLAAGEIHDGMLHLDGIPLTSERLRHELDLALLSEGMDPGEAIVAGGPRAADPHWLGEGPLRAGEAIIFDVFPRSKKTRYYADMTRTFVKGEPAEQLQQMYDATAAALDTALAQIRAGANGRDVHQAVLDSYKAAGFSEDEGPRMTHGTGHGVGLEIHEAPSLSVGDMELVEGDVVTVEPGLYDPAVGGVRIEDIVVVTADGCRNLTRFPRQLRV
jgi:Xaa-Pro aminopeptidase